MFPLIGLAVSFVPELIHLIAGDKAGNVASAVSNAVSAVAGTSDPVEALAKLKADAAASADLQARLAQIAVDAQKAQNDEADKKRQDELATMQANIGNTTSARGTLVALAQSRSLSAWVPLAVSVIVTVGFFVSVGLLIWKGNNLTGANGTGVGDFAAQIINISFGTLATGFATVINFWLGSSQGSKDKDLDALQVQQSHAAQISNVLGTVSSVANSTIDALKTATETTETPKPAATPARDNFDRCVGVTLAMEGKYTVDAGGPTNYGITQRTLAAFRGKDVTADDVKALTSSEAIEIYRANYWNQMRCGDLPSGVDLMVFDYGVNSGPGRSIGDLQKLVGVPVDGAIGKVTLGAVQKVTPRKLVDDLAEARLAFLRTLENAATYGAGWTSRVTQVHEAATKMVG